jgi:hypothetical protein
MQAKWIVIVVLIVVVVAAAAGVGGYMYGQNAGQAQALAARQRFFQERGLAGGQGAGAGGQGTGARGNFNPANFATGQVKQISGNTIELSTATDVLKVNVTDQTQIQKMGAGSVSDIQTGERLIIQGERSTDGVFTARSIQIGRGGPPNSAQNSGQ